MSVFICSENIICAWDIFSLELLKESERVGYFVVLEMKFDTTIRGFWVPQDGMISPKRKRVHDSALAGECLSWDMYYSLKTFAGV